MFCFEHVHWREKNRSTAVGAVGWSRNDNLQCTVKSAHILPFPFSSSMSQENWNEIQSLSLSHAHWHQPGQLLFPWVLTSRRTGGPWTGAPLTKGCTWFLDWFICSRPVVQLHISVIHLTPNAFVIQLFLHFSIIYVSMLQRADTLHILLGEAGSAELPVWPMLSCTLVLSRRWTTFASRLHVSSCAVMRNFTVNQDYQTN